jgi:four helix bundle protein
VGERDVTVELEAGSETREVGSVTSSPGRRKPIQSYRDIEAFQRSMGVLASLDRLVNALPQDERYELASQLRRAAKSVPANIAEGYALKRSANHFRSRLDIALGSANEVVVHLEIAEAIGYFAREQVAPLISEYETIGKLIYRLAQSWRTFAPKPSTT